VKIGLENFQGCFYLTNGGKPFWKIQMKAKIRLKAKIRYFLQKTDKNESYHFNHFFKIRHLKIIDFFVKPLYLFLINK
jgi:hypothetical protein